MAGKRTATPRRRQSPARRRAAKPARADRADRAAREPAPRPAPEATGAAKPVAQWRTLGSGPAARAWADRAASSTAADARRADEVGRLLQTTFGEVLARLPPRVARVADVARWLGLDRSICQRIVIGVRDAT